jgi:Zn finger protein HypA/HybF involved in hydrogenase expression
VFINILFDRLNMGVNMNRITLIEKNKMVVTCLDCNFVYIPLNEIFRHICPNCQHDIYLTLDDDLEIEENI